MTTMTPAEAKTTRERLGVTTEFIADRIGVTKGRVWEYESPTRRRPLPDHAAAVIDGLAATFDRAVEDAARKVPKSGVIPRHASIEAFEAWCPALAGWGAGAQSALVAAVQQKLQMPVEFR